MGFIKWPQFYAAEAEKIKGGIFNDRKCIKVQTPPVDLETKEIKKLVAIIIQRCVYTCD